jgi:hypothetical protein
METMTETGTEKRVDELSKRVDRGFEQVDRAFEQVDRRFEQVDRNFERIDADLREIRVAMGALNRTVLASAFATVGSIIAGIVVFALMHS